MKVLCEQCNGKGHLYTRIAGDVNIADCGDCATTGQIEIESIAATKKPKAAYPSFGKVDIDSLLRE